MHEAVFIGTDTPCRFLTVTNLSRDRDIEITHVWIATSDGQIPVIPADRPLPKRLKPDEPWATWVRADALPADLGERVFVSARLRLSTGRVFKSRRATNVPSQGAVPGGAVTRPPV